MQGRNMNVSGSSSQGRKMSASFGQPVMSERNVVKQGVSSSNHSIAAQQPVSYQNSATRRHARLTSDATGSQKTEMARNPNHIYQGEPISRKQSDFSFASGSQQKNGVYAKSPSNQNQGSYNNQFLLRQSSRSNSSKGRQNLNSDSSRKARIYSPNKQIHNGSGPQTSKGSMVNSSRQSRHNFPQIQQPSNIASIQEEENEMDYGTQALGSSQTIKGHTSSSQGIANFLNNTGGSTNLANSYLNSHLNSLGVTTNTLMPRIYSQDNTPSSLQQMQYPNNTAYFVQPIGAQRDSFGESNASSSNSITLLNLKLDQVTRYAEMCERRILDYQPDHPLPVRPEHLGGIFAAAGTTSGHRTRTTGSPISQGNRSSENRPIQFSVTQHHHHTDTQGSPRALKQHVDTVSVKNHQLELALREETLANEEQRNYIQILKNVIEQKLERDGLLELLKEAGRQRRAEQQKTNFLNQQRLRKASPSPEPEKQDEAAINLYVVLSDMKYQLDSKSKEVQRFIEQLKTQDEHARQLLMENQHYEQELQNRTIEFQQTQNRYQEFDKQLKILHKQKEDLLDCVESQVNQIEALKSDLIHERSRFSQMRISSAAEVAQHTQQSQYIQRNTSNQDVSSSYTKSNPKIIGLTGDQNFPQNEVSSQSLMNNGIDLSYSREMTEQLNQTLLQQQTAQLHQLEQLQHQQQQLAEQVQIVNQAAINAAQQSMTLQHSQESVGSMPQNYGNSSQHTFAIEQYQKHMVLKDQEIIKLRVEIDQASSELFAKQQENDSLNFTKNQLQKRLEMAKDKSHQQEDFRAKQLESTQSMLYEEQRKVENLQLHYESEIRKCQREINLIREEQTEKDSLLDSIQKTNERLTKEIELKETQLDSCRVQAQKDSKEIRDLKTSLDEAQLETERLRKDRERRQDAELTDGKTKEQLSQEKHYLVSQLNELQHQFEVFKTQKQTEAHRADSTVRDAQIRVEVLEKATKKQIVENETLQRDYTSCAVKLKQSEVQTAYLEKSNQQMMDELRQTKLDYDDVNRQKGKLEVKIHDLEAQIDVLNKREGQNKRLYEQVTEAQLQTKTKEGEIEKLDSKLRKVYLLKEEFEVESIQLRKALQELKATKDEYASQKEMLTSQNKDCERRIFDLIREKQDQDKKIRENVILIRDLVEERDKFKHAVSDKEDEIVELGMQVKQWRSNNTDLKLIEEKVEHFLNEMKQLIQQNRKNSKPQLQEFLRLVNASETLSSKVSMRKREDGHQFLEKLDQRHHQATHLEGDKSYTSQIWQTMIQVKEAFMFQSNLQEYFTEMLHLFLADSVDLQQKLTHKQHTVSNLEGKLGTIHSIDFKAQTDSHTLRKEVFELQQKLQEEENCFQEELAKMQQSLEQKTMAEQELAQELKQLKQKLKNTDLEAKSTNYVTNGAVKKMEKELWSATAEKRRFEEVLKKVQDTILCGTRAQDVVEEMKRCSKTLAQIDASREMNLNEIDELEVRLSQVNSDNQIAAKENKSQISAIQKVKKIRTELSQKEDLIRDLDERINLEVAKLQSLGNELKMAAPSQMTSTVFTQNAIHSKARQTRDNLSLSPHRQNDSRLSPHSFIDNSLTRAIPGGGYNPNYVKRIENNDGYYQERPSKDYKPDREQSDTQHSRPYGGYGNEPDSVGLATQQLNTYNMANLLKETKDLHSRGLQAAGDRR